jgi:hypothetical protein
MRLLLLGSLAATITGLAQTAPVPPVRRFPPTPFVVDVKQPPYNAKGDGTADDTDALQAALNDHVGRHRLLYFPNGTYLVSRTLTWPKRWDGRDNWGKTFLCGASRDGSTLRLKDGTFTDPARPQALMWCGGFGSADWFHNYVENLTFDVGRSNAGATALQFYANNSGAVRDCRFLAGEGSGVVGLDLEHRDMNGPLLVRNCEVSGFSKGVAAGHSVNSQTFENLFLRGQREVGFQNQGQALSVRNLTSDNAVPAMSSYGVLTLLDATLTGRGPASNAPAIVNYNGGRIFLREVRTTGYRRALADLRTPDFAAAFRLEGADKPGSQGPDVDEYCSQPATSPFPSPAHSLRLPVKETPEVPWDDLPAWANVDAFGADPTGQADSSAAVQKALDSGATTVFLPGNYRLDTSVVIRGRVRRVLGLGGMINYGREPRAGGDFRVEAGDAPTVSLEHFSHIGGGLEVATRRTLVLRSVSDCPVTSTAAAEGGEIFLEDVVTHDLRLHRQRVWARQLNIENQGTHLRNEAGDLWVLGYKTERGGTLLATRGGGRSEILGGLSYTTTAGKLAPMIVNDNSSVFTFFHEVCYTGDPFAVRVEETRGTETRTVRREAGDTAPYSGRVARP